jgi:type I restriction enzyme S subunit
MSDMGWIETTLGQVVRLQRGHDLPETERVNGIVPVMGSFGRTGWHDKVKQVGPGVTIGRSGGSIGVVSYVEQDYWPLNTALYVTDFLGNDPRFCYYWLGTLGLANFNSGSAQPSLNRNHIYEIDVNVPPILEQQSIAEILSSLDEKIELNRKQNRTLEAIAQALFKRWFVEFEFPDENGRPYKSSGGAMQPSELGEIPVGWEVKLLSDVTIYLSRGITPAYVEEGGVMVLNQRCVRDGWINTEPARRHDVETRKIEGRELKAGDVLVNSTGMGTLGRVAQALALDSATVVDSHITVVRAEPSQVSSEYLGVCLRLKEREIEHMAEGSTGQTELSRAKLGELPVIVPDDGVLRLFTEVVADLNSKRALNWGESLSLTLARDTLLPKLMSGEFRVA